MNSPLPPELTVGWAERVGAVPGWGRTRRGSARRFGASRASCRPRWRSSRCARAPPCSARWSCARRRSTACTFLAGRLPVLESFGAVASALLAPGILARQQRGEVRGELEAVLEDDAFEPSSSRSSIWLRAAIVGHEALTRFRDGTRPDRRFADAEAVGLGLELESACLSAAHGGVAPSCLAAAG